MSVSDFAQLVEYVFIGAMLAIILYAWWVATK